MSTRKVEFGPFDDDVLPKQIVDRLLTLIKENKLRPGDKLPPERELAATMAIGRPSVREALQALSIMNIIEIRQGSGAYVSSLEPADLVEHLDFIFYLHDIALIDLIGARRIVEVGAVSLATERITGPEIEELECCLEQMAETIGDPKAFALLEFELHKQLGQASHNPFLARCMETLAQMSLGSQECLAELLGVAEESLLDHGAIIVALKSGDPEAARQATLCYLDGVETKLRRFVSINGASR